MNIKIVGKLCRLNVLREVAGVAEALQLTQIELGILVEISKFTSLTKKNNSIMTTHHLLDTNSYIFAHTPLPPAAAHD